jgi:hypothetical protein
MMPRPNDAPPLRGSERIPPGLFKESPEAIARGLARVARLRARKEPRNAYRTAMSMLTFYMNRAGQKLRPRDRARLERAKDSLRRLFQR